jgi:hypothetical protein
LPEEVLPFKTRFCSLLWETRGHKAEDPPVREDSLAAEETVLFQSLFLRKSLFPFGDTGFFYCTQPMSFQDICSDRDNPCSIKMVSNKGMFFKKLV